MTGERAFGRVRLNLVEKPLDGAGSPNPSPDTEAPVLMGDLLTSGTMTAPDDTMVQVVSPDGRTTHWMTWGEAKAIRAEWGPSFHFIAPAGDITLTSTPNVLAEARVCPTCGRSK